MTSGASGKSTDPVITGPALFSELEVPLPPDGPAMPPPSPTLTDGPSGSCAAAAVGEIESSVTNSITTARTMFLLAREKSVRARLGGHSRHHEAHSVYGIRDLTSR